MNKLLIFCLVFSLIVAFVSAQQEGDANTELRKKLKEISDEAIKTTSTLIFYVSALQEEIGLIIGLGEKLREKLDEAIQNVFIVFEGTKIGEDADQKLREINIKIKELTSDIIEIAKAIINEVLKKLADYIRKNEPENFKQH